MSPIPVPHNPYNSNIGGYQSNFGPPHLQSYPMANTSNTVGPQKFKPASKSLSKSSKSDKIVPLVRKVEEKFIEKDNEIHEEEMK